MTYLLDSNTCIQSMRPKGNVLVKARLLTTPAGDIAVCTVVVGELYYGAERSGNVAAERAKVDGFIRPYTNLPFDHPASSIHATVRAVLAAGGQSIGPYDLMIAATALANNLTLVTHNTREFSRVPGLALVDWEVP